MPPKFNVCHQNDGKIDGKASKKVSSKMPPKFNVCHQNDGKIDGKASKIGGLREG